ncbi:hypothetical protein FQN54_002013 [Arachnomyces sp. PD_36]|nr:hypothetical protein FQN54_002013 [Arachnomyces sp. PD_36]
MKRLALQAQGRGTLRGPICQICEVSTLPRLQQRSFSQSSSPRTLRHDLRQLRSRRGIDTQLAPYNGRSRGFATKKTKGPPLGDYESTLRDLQRESRSIETSTTVPSEESVVRLLRRCHRLVEEAIMEKPKEEPPASEKEEGKSNAKSLLLNLEEGSAAPADKPAKPAAISKTLQQEIADTISPLITGLLQDPKVFITPQVLAHYTKTQCLLKQADYFPEIFTLYANKPIPRENSSPIQYDKQSPRSVKNAVPAELANMALDIAIDQRNLPLVLAIIDSSFCAPAFYRSKIFRKAALPMSGLTAAPAASYMAATYFATSLQTTMDTSTATGIAFAGILAYITFTSTVGVVAITTANDQMERVVWAPGMPLRQRWLREEERFALDKVAQAWGFKEAWMRGEEEGEEWESLREFIGLRGMILDKTELMEGME